MARSSIRISIPQPCNVPWESMQPVDAEKRYCSSCERVITDFSKMSDAELLAYFQKHKNHCGRFLKSQLDREIFFEKERSAQGWKKLLLLPSLLLSIGAAAQKTGTGHATNPATAQAAQPASSRAKQQPEANLKAVPKLQGIVIDSVSGAPLTDCVVIISVATHTFNATTDSTGKFSIALAGIPLNDSLKIQVSYAGYIHYESSVLFSAAPLRIALEPQVMNEVIVITNRQNEYEQVTLVGTNPGWISEPARKPVRGFFYRLFHRKRY